MKITNNSSTTVYIGSSMEMCSHYAHEIPPGGTLILDMPIKLYAMSKRPVLADTVEMDGEIVEATFKDGK